MHTFFAKPLFLGKKVDFLTECHSTNTVLMDLAKNGEVEEGYLVYTAHQTGGKGQRGNAWIDQLGKNALLSVLLLPNYLNPSEQFMLNLTVSLGVLKTTARYIDEKRLKLKWPNDILIHDRKICGILIESVIQGNKLEKAVIGIGFNLNQQDFGAFHATSVLNETGEEVVLEDFIENLLIDLEYFLLKLKNGQRDTLIQLYHEKLYRKGELGTYKDEEGIFEGTILGVDPSGKLIMNSGGKLKHYGMKEIQFLH